MFRKSLFRLSVFPTNGQIPLSQPAGATAAPAPGAAGTAQQPTTSAKSVPILDLHKTKVPMIKSFRLDEIMPMVSTKDALFARKMSQGNCQYFAWPGLDHQTAANAIVSMPDTIRTCHTIFGRHNVPVDIALDLDGSLPSDCQNIERAMKLQREALFLALGALGESIKILLPNEKVQSRVVLQSPNLSKISYHVHVKLADTAFDDVFSLAVFMKQAKEKFPKELALVDLQIYRMLGMLRMHRCMKENRTCSMIVFADPKANLGFGEGALVPEADAALHSLIIRDVATVTKPLISMRATLGHYPSGGGTATLSQVEHDGRESAWPKRACILMPIKQDEACVQLQRFILNIPAKYAEEWKSWIAVGLAAYQVAYHFRDAKVAAFDNRPVLDVILEAWIEFSRKCPIKFENGTCEKTWQKLTPTRLKDANNWFNAYRKLGQLAAERSNEPE